MNYQRNLKMSEKTYKEILEDLINEVEKELEEHNTTANVDGYQTPYIFW